MAGPIQGTNMNLLFAKEKEENEQSTVIFPILFCLSLCMTKEKLTAA